MPTRLFHIAVDAAAPGPLARFWAAALGWPVLDEDEDEVEIGPPGSDPLQDGQLPIVFLRVPEAKTGKNRVHFALASRSINNTRMTCCGFASRSCRTRATMAFISCTATPRSKPASRSIGPIGSTWIPVRCLVGH